METRERFALLAGMQTGPATVGSCMKKPQKIKNRSVFQPSDPTSGNVSEEFQNTNWKEHEHPMFIAASFTITKIWKQSECPSVDERIKQPWDICTVEFYWAMKKNQVLPFVTAWMDLENIMLSEISQSERQIQYDFIHL